MNEQLPLFPDLEEAQYTSAPDIGLQVDALLAQHDNMAQLTEELRSGRLNLAYLWDNRPFGAAEELRPHTLARTYKAPAIWEALTGYQAVIVVRKALYAQFTATQRDAIVFHELLHLDVREPGKFRLRRHDLEEFALVVRYYGTYLPDRKLFFKSWRVWQAEQDMVKPESKTELGDPEE